MGDKPLFSALSASRRFNVFVLIALFLLVAYLGARDLSRDSLWYDEYWSIYDAGGAPFERRSPAQIWAGVAERNPWQAPGYFFALAGWGALAGWSEVAGRSLSLFVGLLGVAWTYRLGKDMGGRLVGLAAATTLGASAFFVHYLHELRGYTFYALFAALTVWAYWRILNHRARPVIFAALFAGMVGLFYTHYFAALVVVMLALYHLFVGIGILLRRHSTNPVKRARHALPLQQKIYAWMGFKQTANHSALTTHPSSLIPHPSLLSPQHWFFVSALILLSAAAFLPWAGVTLRAAGLISGDETRQALAMPPSLVVENLLYLFSSGSVALFAVIAFFAARVRTRAAGLVWFWLLVVLALALLVNAALAILSEDRYLMALYPALALVAGFGVLGLKRAGVPPALVLGVWIVAGVWNSGDASFRDGKLHPPFWYLPWRELAAEVRPHAQRSDVVIMHLPDVVWRWMHDPLAEYYLYGLPVRKELMESLPGMTDADYTALERDYLDESRRVWLAYDPSQQPARLPLFEQTLSDAGYAHCSTPADTSEIRLDLYARVPADLADAAYRFGDGIGLTLMERLPAAAQGKLDALLGWTVDPAVPPDAYSYGLHVTDADGNLVAQFDSGLPPAGTTCLPASVDLSALPPGDYTLNALVYDWRTGERLPGAGEGQAGDRLVVGQFRVERR